MKKPLVIAIFVIVTLICLCIMTIAFIYISQNYHFEKAPAEEKNISRPLPPEVEVILPQQGASYAINDYVPLVAGTSGYNKIVAFEVWIDGQLYASSAQVNIGGSTNIIDQWSWQPATLGSHSILFRSVDEKGLTAYSEIIQIKAGEATGTVSPINPAEGQTLQDVAAEKNVPVEELVAQNPTLEIDAPLSPDVEVFVPNPPDEVEIVDISQNKPYQPPPPPPGSPGGTSIINDIIQFLPVSLQKAVEPVLQNGGADNGSGGGSGNGSAGSPPMAPTLIKSEQTGSCEVYMEFKDISSTEQGFRVFRANPYMTDFSMESEMPPQIGNNITYSDKGLNIKGKWSYYVEAYNTFGKTQSLPVVFDISDPSCFPPEPDQSKLIMYGPLQVVTFTDEMMVETSKKVEQAFVYLTVNGQTRRIPDDVHTFMQGSGYHFDLMPYLLSIVDTLPPTTDKYYIKVELWGWDNFKPYLIGSYNKVIENMALLYACLITPGDNCDSENSAWNQRVVIPEEMDPATAQIRYKLVTLKKHHQPYLMMGVENQFHVPPYYELFSTHFIGETSVEYPPLTPMYFDANLGKHLTSNPNLTKGCVDKYHNSDSYLKEVATWDCESNELAYNRDEFVVGATVALYAGSPGAFPESNRVYIAYKSRPVQTVEESTTYTPTWPDLYQIEFLEDTYTPAVPARPDRWGCYVYKSGDKKGIMECPEIIPGDPCANTFSSSCMEAGINYEVGEIKKALEWGVKCYDLWVNGYVEGLQRIIPGCKENKWCAKITQTAVYAVWTYLTGLPPQAPSSEKLAEEGIEYLVEYGVETYVEQYLGNPEWFENLPPEVKEELKSMFGKGKEAFKKELTKVLISAYINAKQQGMMYTSVPCIYPDAARARGKVAKCPDPGVEWEPAEGAAITPPTIQVKITRKPITENNNFGTDATSVTSADKTKYGLRITSKTINNYRVGKKLAWSGYKEDITSAECHCSEVDSETGIPQCVYVSAVPCWWVIDKPMEGGLYKNIEIPIPWLEPGESTIITIKFENQVYWSDDKEWAITQHTNAESFKWGALYGDDWEYLYWGGETTFTAEEVCPSNQAKKVFCGSKDEYMPEVPDPTKIMNWTTEP